MTTNNPLAGYLRLKTILTLIPISRSGWWAGVKTGRFPKSYKLGPRTTAWRTADIEELIRQLSENEAGKK